MQLTSTAFLALTSTIVSLTSAQSSTTLPAALAATELGRMSAFNSPDFVFDFNANLKIGPGGKVAKMDVSSLPSLRNQKLSFAYLQMEPCGINLPHIHPRAAEEIFVIAGQNVSMGFIEENGGAVRQNYLKQGQATFFPQGSMHFQFNDNCEPATLLAALNNEDPGALTITTNFFKLPNGVIEASLGLPGDDQQRALAGQINIGSPLALANACKARCSGRRYRRK